MAESLVHLLRDSVNHMPDAEAVVHGKRRVSYKELWEETCKVANYLRGQDLKRGARVGILLENSPEYIAAYYGILAVGGIAVGLNTTTKARDLINWIRHSDATWLVADAGHPELLEITRACEGKTRIIIVGESDGKSIGVGYMRWQDVLRCGKDEPDYSVVEDTDQLATIIYTSGTTGNPKGVMLSHENLRSNIESILDYLRLESTDRILNVLPFYYSYGNSILHTHLAVGGSLVLENNLMYPHAIMEKMVKEDITGFSGVPSTFAILLSRTKLQDYDLSKMKYMTQAGGPMAPANITRLRELLPKVQFFVMYGQTEATARLTYLPPEKLEEKLGSAGVPIPGVQIEIRSEQEEQVPPGVTGEVCATGKNIMKGYWENENATRKVLRDGWLRTGDLGYMDDDGFIFLTGRSSEMIKTGANRISPKEIEEVIAEFDGIEEVAVVGVPDEILGQLIKAVIVPCPGVDLKVQDIKAHCRKNLALYKIPKFIEFAMELPKTASGKIKRYLLSEVGESNVNAI